MNAKSERASLPDRVEAAAKAVAEMGWFDPAKWSYAALETVVEVALAAADAREAERKSLTTRELLDEVATRMEATQNSLKGDDLGRLCREALANLDTGVLDYAAERNPNTTDDEPIAAWLHPTRAPQRYAGQDEAQMLALGWEPVFRRRPVSSEDVHREERT